MKACSALSLFLLLAFLLPLIGFYYFPIVEFLAQSVIVPDESGHWSDAYRFVADNQHLRGVIGKTFLLTLLIAALSVLLAYPVAYLLVSERYRVAAVILVLVLVPLWTSILVRTYAWQVIFQSKGIVNSFLISLGLADKPVDLLYNEFAVVVGSVHVLVPIAILPLAFALRRIDPVLVRAGSSLGASPLRVFVSIIAPLSLPGVLAAFILVFIMALGFFVTPAILGGGKVIMLAMEIQRYVGNLLDWRTSAALSTILLVGTIALVMAFRRAFRHAGIV